VRKLKKLSNTEKILVIVVSILMIGLIYYRFFLKSISAKTQTVKQEITMSNDKINAIKNAEAQNKKMVIQLKDIKVKFEESTELLPQSERNPEIPYAIKKIADLNSIIINEIALGNGAEYIIPGKAKAGQASSTVLNAKLMACPVTLKISSDYRSLINFMAALEKDKRIAEIDSTNITKQDSKVNGSINLKYYYINSGNEESVKYEFNVGAYGKPDLFK
jgi:Tfp pilus assembly protein PilO